MRLKGTVHSHRATILCAKRSGVLGDILISSGLVKKGDKIANLENATLSEKFILEKKQADRAIKLHKSQAIAPKEYEREYQEYLRSKEQFEDTEFVAPFDGVLGVFQFSKGDYMNASESLVALYDDTTLFVKFDLPSHLASKVQSGQSVLIEGQFYQELSVQKMLDGKTHMLPAKIETPHLQKLIGEIIDVDVITVQKEGVLTIPMSAVFMQDKKNYVYIMSQNKAHMREVELGLQDKERVEVLKGIKEKDQVIVRNPQRLFDQMEVIV